MQWLPYGLAKAQKSIQHYFTNSFSFDLTAGVTVALIAIPQSMAYAAIAGISPIYGLYTAIVPAIIAATLGSSNYLVTGVTNATALATAGVLMGVSNRPDFLEFVFALAIISGLIKLLLGVCRLGSITRFISNSVMTGFLAGVGILIIVNQLNNALGIPGIKGGTVAILANSFLKLGQANPYVLATSVFTLAILLTLRRINNKIPAAMIAIVSAGFLVHWTGWEKHGVRLVAGLGNPSFGNLFHVPQIGLPDMEVLLSGAGALALISLVEAISVSQAISLNKGDHFNPSREFIAQGLASILGGFFQSMPSSGSPSRSAVSINAGARGRWAAAFSGFIVLLALILFSNLIGYISMASLAAVVITSAYSMIDWHHIRLTWHSRTVSRVVLLVTFLSTLLLPIQIAIYLGALLSILIYLYESSKLNITYLKVSEQGEFVEYNLRNLLDERSSIAIVDVEGSLYFGAAEDLHWKLEKVLASGVKVVILRMRHTRQLASTGVTAIEGLVKRAQKAGVQLILSGLSNEMKIILQTSGVEELIGSDHIFLATPTVFETTRQALCCAKIMLSQLQENQ